MNNKIEKRKINLDILRILSMIMIVTWHFLGHGQIMNNLEFGTARYYVAWVLESISLISVNIFFLISGYFLVDSKFKISKVIKLILEITFYTVTIYLLFCIFGIIKFSFLDFIKMCIPFFTNQYWFMTKYILLYLLFPYINKLINSLNKNEFKQLCILLIFLGCIINPILRFFNGKTFNLISIDIKWFIILYIIGAYFKKYNVQIPIKKLVNTFVLFFIILFSSKVIPELLYNVGIKKDILLNTQKLFYNNSSIFTLFMSVDMFLIFESIHIKTNKFDKVIFNIAQLVFGVYLIHDNRIIRNFLWGIVKPVEIWNSKYFLIKSFIVILSVFFMCICIEYIRKKIFEVLKFYVLVDKIEKKICNKNRKEDYE